MAVQVVDRSRMTSDLTPHQAKSVGAGGWVVSFLPGRTLTLEQATAALQAAEAVAAVNALAGQVGLTAIETVGLAIQESPWGEPEPCTALSRVFRRRFATR
ncbi:hypothetical protein [Nocardia seriolae]|uniref:hypothetical protein n=2 Tax=Nocardia seriolae TaxID=37332 RepID=UPI0009DF173E|nr:hypothetical protein [Nocardia seriolae]MTJ66783.1 hypothetical protein [Nocardia seriolae]MTJ70418.1 hypothetical protein [Nocardia seriolae]MTJ85381.1 hypothetical protein [Nocardia seriolae]MTK29377.1 hypothetical protein [Nocardia seriolae]MTK44716.1 hypothetical protein [Nocardia seriolae]